MLTYVLSDHLGSTSLVTDANGAIISQTKYKAWGEVRQATGTSPTNYTYTGQYSYTADFGLMYYNARWYDPALGRFAQADTIVPGGVQGLDRYAYVNNSPMNFVDPSGHVPCDEEGYCYEKGRKYKNPTRQPSRYSDRPILSNGDLDAILNENNTGMANTGDQITYTFQGQSYGAIVVDPENQILWDMRTRSRITWDEIRNMVNALYKLNSQGSFDIVPGINEDWQELPQALGPVNSDDLVGETEMLKIYSTNIEAQCDEYCKLGFYLEIAGLQDGLTPLAAAGITLQVLTVDVRYSKTYEIVQYQLPVFTTFP